MTKGLIVYVVQRTVLIFLTAIVVSSLVFLGIHRLPGDAILSEHNPNPAVRRALLHQYGLDQPLWMQYWHWLTGVLHGDLGQSLVVRGTEITPLLIREASVSLSLGLWAMLFAVVVGMTLGVVAAIRQNTWTDYGATFFATVGFSIPGFVVATLAVLITVVPLYNLTHGAIYENVGGWGLPEQVPVPAISLGILPMSLIARLTRASMLETIRQDYVRTAWAKGLKQRVVIVRHALRNALIPVVTVLGPVTAGVITGSVVIEQIFGIPGLGKEFVTSILSRDYNIVIGVFTFYAMLVGLANLIVDVTYPILDPRIRY